MLRLTRPPKFPNLVNPGMSVLEHDEVCLVDLLQLHQLLQTEGCVVLLHHRAAQGYRVSKVLRSGQCIVYILDMYRLPVPPLRRQEMPNIQLSEELLLLLFQSLQLEDDVKLCVTQVAVEVVWVPVTVSYS